jgi:hypothetical protein
MGVTTFASVGIYGELGGIEMSLQNSGKRAMEFLEIPLEESENSIDQESPHVVLIVWYNIYTCTG